jgi:hypothetical protein
MDNGKMISSPALAKRCFMTELSMKVNTKKAKNMAKVN